MDQLNHCHKHIAQSTFICKLACRTVLVSHDVVRCRAQCEHRLSQIFIAQRKFTHALARLCMCACNHNDNKKAVLSQGIRAMPL